MKSGVMTFYIKSEKEGEFVRRWNHLLAEVQEMPGFVSALLLVGPENNQAIGIGVWEDEKTARDFVKGRHFRKFMEDAGECMSVEPTRQIFDVSGYSFDVGLQAA